MAEKRVLLVHTGGTLGMRRGPRGYVPEAGHLATLLQGMPELAHPDVPPFRLLEPGPLLDSSDARPRDWQAMADTLAAHRDEAAGFVVLHGTDTMAYSASAVAFLLEGLDRPVVFTGAQVPLAEPRSDARENLVTSLMLAARADLPEVAVFFGGRLLRAVRTTKTSGFGFDAFESPNAPDLGRAGVSIEVDAGLVRAPGTPPLRATRIRDVHVLALRLFPGIGADTLRNVLRKPVEGMVLETYGAGNGPRDPALLGVLEEATSRGVVIVNVSQCLRGRVRMGRYATGYALAEAGLVPGGDMTPEAALSKLMVLLATGDAPAEVRRAMGTDLRGELDVAGHASLTSDVEAPRGDRR